jgi:hypothetical protein
MRAHARSGLDPSSGTGARITLRGLVWELPQNVVGALLFAGETARGRVVRVERQEDRVVIETTGTAVSLGHLVFWSQRSNRWHNLDVRNRAHELGHAHQSRMLGPLYLPVVGIPSTARAAFAVAFREITGRKWDGYYRGFPERWADELGGVDRTGTSSRAEHADVRL